MTAAITDFFHTLFGDNVVLATILIAIMPLIELKGAIPFGMSTAFWGAKALVAWQAFIYAFLGSIIIVPILALVFRPLYNWMRTKKFFNKVVDFLVGDVVNRSQKVDHETTTVSTRKSFWLKVLAIVLFVAFPVPLTGVWTGTCFAVLLGLNFWQTCATVILGNAICGLIVTFVCAVFPGASNYFLYAFLAIILVAVVVKVVLHLTRRKKVGEGVSE